MKYLKQMLCVGICGVMLAAATGCRLFRLTDGRQAHHSHFSCTVRNPP